ncbi:RloB family protein [Sedimenticola hydrogenitrophicus]|uniref:RloB family protein n=1 Tax=Sedimenticola hydrogenitrophicus TaxID=2967975 RepID=UPI0021A3F9DE|nr:RloB family protein [Sedimenticola hydrogenitrophicus]
MGTDDLFHKRKAKSAARLKRREINRAPYAKVLIVCEGEKTEPNYFNGLRDHYGLNTANVEVCGECGSDPMGIIRHARQRYREEKDAGDTFDGVYCVFDKDTHAHYDQAVDTVRRMTPKDTYFAITSVPCFEYWLLLHFIYTTRPYTALPGNSAGNQVLAELKGYMPGYEKGAGTVFSSLVGQLEFAKGNAARALRAAEDNGMDNPSTRVHLLVDFLQNIMVQP